jgi:N,N'-diacetyllegionaminate synthase
MKRTSLVGEIGLSHEGSLGTALSMIDACKKADLDYAKFQFHNPDFESTKDEVFRVNSFPQDDSRYNFWKRTSFTEDQWQIIIAHCESVHIKFLCTPFSVWAAQKLVDLGSTEVKIASGDANNWELLNFAKQHFSKIFVSTGMSTKSELKGLINFMNDFIGELIILQCTSSYPVEPKNVGMKFFDEILDLTGKVGLSDHSGNPFVPITAIARFADLIEFHVVYSKDQFGPDSTSSLTFDEAKLVSSFRNLWNDLYDPEYDKDIIASNLIEIRKKFGRGLSLSRDLKEGEIVLEEFFTLKKPLGPLNWDDRFFLAGKRAKYNISSNQHITQNDFE